MTTLYKKHIDNFLSNFHENLEFIYGGITENTFEERKNQLQRETNDRVTVQKNSLDGYMLNKKYEFNQRIQQAFSERKESLAKSQQTRWKNIEANLLIKIEKLELQKSLFGTPSFVAAGLIAFSKS